MAAAKRSIGEVWFDVKPNLSGVVGDINSQLNGVGEGLADSISENIQAGAEEGGEAAQEATEEGAGSGFKAAGGAVLAAIAAWGIAEVITAEIGTALENEQVFANLEAGLNLNEKELAKVQEVSKDLFKGNYGAEMGEVTGIMKQIMSTSSEMRNASADDLYAMGRDFMNLAQVYELDSELLASNLEAFQKHGMGSADEFTDVITTMMTNLGPQGADALDSMNEFMDELGSELNLNGKEMGNMFINGVTQGFGSTAGMADAIQEMGILAEDGSDDWKEAIKGIGMDPKAVQKAAKEGGTAWKTTFTEILTGLQKVDFANGSGVAVIGGMFEENSAAFRKADWANIFEDNAKTIKNSALEIDATIGGTLGSTIESLKRTFGAALQEGLAPVLEAIRPHLEALTKWMSDNPGKVALIAGLIGGALVAAIVALTVAIVAQGIAMIANPTTWIILGIVAAVAALAAAVYFIVANWEPIMAWFTETFNGLGGTITGWLTDIGGFFTSVGADIADFWNFMGALSGSVFGGAVNDIKEFFGVIFNFWDTAFSTIINSVGIIKQVILQVFKDIGNFFIGIANIIIDSVNVIIDALNGLHIKIPDWKVAGVKVFGDANGQSFGPNLGRLGSIPMLATGADILGPTIAMLGEGGQPETVVNRGVMNDNLELMNSRLKDESTGSGNTIQVYAAPGMDEEMLAEKVVRVLDRNRRR